MERRERHGDRKRLIHCSGSTPTCPYMSLRPLGTTQAAHPDIEVIEGALTLLRWPNLTHKNDLQVLWGTVPHLIAHGGNSS